MGIKAELTAGDIIRFWSHVDTSAGQFGCWPWTAALSGNGAKRGNGYGQFSVSSRLIRSTHIAWFLTHGVWPEHHMLHDCDNPPCVNANHLHDGDDFLNTQERIERHGHRFSEKLRCPQGHLYSGSNLYVSARGDRQCRTCMRAANRRYKDKQKGG